MPEMDSHHCQLVAESLSGERDVDERTFASLSILAERLERLRELGPAFGKVGFSSDVEQLLGRNSAVPIA